MTPDPPWQRWCHKRADVPTDAHYAILYFKRIHIEGDERSRQAPGHGYPAHDEQVCEYVVYSDRATWTAEIERLQADRFEPAETWVPLLVAPATVRTTVSVEVDVSAAERLKG